MISKHFKANENRSKTRERFFSDELKLVLGDRDSQFSVN